MVRVTVVEVEGSEGGSVAGVLSKGAGPEALLLTQAQQDPNHYVGGFGVAVDADPFTTTQTINKPARGERFVFPYVTDAPVQVEPGTYTLMLWAAPQKLTPLSTNWLGRWEPGLAAGMRGCWVTFEAEAGTGANLTVKGIPEWHGVPVPCATASGMPSAGCSGLGAGPVRVTVVDLEGSQGGSAAGVLSKGAGPEAAAPSRYPDDPADHWVGGFGVAVDADPFTTTQTVNEPRLGPLDFSDSPFPHVTDTPLMVEPGTYTLMLWAQDRPLSMFSRWYPSRDGNLRFCWGTFEVAAGVGATVTINGIPEGVEGDTEMPKAQCARK